MIQTFYQIGKAIKDDPEFEMYFQPWGNPFIGREKDAKVIIAEIVDKKFEKIYIEDFRKNYIEKYLYRIGSTGGRATNSVPTVPFIDVNTSFNKIEQSIKNYRHDFLEKEELQKVRKALQNIDLDNNISYLFTFKIDSKYFGEYKKLVDLFKNNAYNSFHTKVFGKSCVDEYVCAVTGESSRVYGFVDSLGFTVNDNSYMRSGFSQSNSYKMFPVSPEAAIIISGIKSLVFTNAFAKHFSGNTKYLILPKFISNINDDIINETFKLFENKQAFSINNNEEKGTKGFINKTENFIAEILDDKELRSNDLFYEILFYQEKQSQTSLLLQLSDIRPSRLNKIMDAKTEIEKKYKDLTNYDDGKKSYFFSINLVSIQNFILTEQGKKKIPHPYFYKLVESIFYGKKVKKEVFVGFLLTKARKAFKENSLKPYELATAVKEGFVVMQFLESLNIFEKHYKSNVMEQNEQQVKLDAFGFIDQHPDFFNVNYKKGAFLFGCLVTRLMYNQPGNAFLKELNDLNIDKQLLEKKFPKLISKLRQYGQEFRELEQEAAKFLTEQDKVAKDDVSFAVTLGLILQKEFDVKNKKIKEVETDFGIKHEIINT